MTPIPDKGLFRIFQGMHRDKLNFCHEGQEYSPALEWGDDIFHNHLYDSWISLVNDNQQVLRVIYMSGIHENDGDRRSEVELVSLEHVTGNTGGKSSTDDISLVERSIICGRVQFSAYQGILYENQFQGLQPETGAIKDPRPWLERLVKEYYSD